MTPTTPSPLRFDDRPWFTVLLARGWRASLTCTVLVAVITVLTTTADQRPNIGLTATGIKVLAVFAGALVLWISGAVPLVVTALGVFLGLCATGIDTPAVIATWFWRDIVFFLLGAFLIAGSLSSAHVIDHAALRLVGTWGTTARRLRLLLFGCAFFASFFMSEHAVMALFFPLACRIRDAIGRPTGSSRYVTSLFFALAWGATIGGIVTYLGGARNALAMGFLQESGTAPLGFFALMAHTLPVALPLAALAILILEWAFPIDIDRLDQAQAALAERRRELGRFGARQITVTLILLATIIAWAITGPKAIAVVALASAVVLLGSGLVRWRDVGRHVPWDLLLLYGSALALAKALETTGAHRLAAEGLIPALSYSPMLTLGLLAVAAILLTEAISNAAVVSVLVPLVLGLATQIGVNPLHATLAIALASGLSFMLPMGSPPLAIAFASGEFKIRTMAAWGVVLNVVAIPLIVLAAWLVWARL